MIQRFFSPSDFLQSIEASIQPLIPVWSRHSRRLPDLYKHALHALHETLIENIRSELLIAPPFQLEEANIEKVRQSIPGWAKDSLPTECIRDILRVLRMKRLIEAPSPRVRFTTSRRLVVDHSSRKIAYWGQWNSLGSFWLDTTLAYTPILTGDIRDADVLAEWEHHHHEFACSAMFALLIDGAGIRHLRGSHYRYLELAQIDVTNGWVTLPFSGFQPKRKSSRLRFRIPLGTIAQLFLNRYLLFLVKWKQDLGATGLPIFPPPYRPHLEKNFAHWLAALTSGEKVRRPPPWIGNKSNAATAKTVTTKIVSKFIYSARAILVQTLPPFLVASTTGQVRYVPATAVSFNRLFAINTKARQKETRITVNRSSPNTTVSLPRTFTNAETPEPFVDVLPPEVAELPLKVERAIDQVRECLRPLKKGLQKETLRLIAQDVQKFLAPLHALSAETTDSINAPESNLRLFFEHVTDMLYGRVSSGLGKLAPATIERYFTGMVDQILLCVGSINLLALRDTNQVGTIVALAMRGHLNPRTQRAVKTQWSAFFAYLNSRDHAIPEVNSRDHRLSTTWDGYEYDLLTYDDLDRIIESVRKTEKNDTQASVYALIYILAGYAGLRLHEICGIRLRDIIITQNHLLLRIHVSKSPAGRRTLPLNLLLENSDYKLFTEYLIRRHDSVQHLPDWLDLPFFTLHGTNSRIDEESLGRKARSHLSQAPFRVTLHDLRHMFASWMLVRWYVARYGTPADVSFLHHRIFDKTCSQNLLHLFDWVSDRSFETADTNHDPTLYLIARLMGHAFPTTTIETYIHTFDVIHKLFVLSGGHSPFHPRFPSVMTQQSASNLLACDDVTANGLIRKAAFGQVHGYQTLKQECNPNTILTAQRDRIADGGRKKR